MNDQHGKTGALLIAVQQRAHGRIFLCIQCEDNHRDRYKIREYDVNTHQSASSEDDFGIRRQGIGTDAEYRKEMRLFRYAGSDGRDEELCHHLLSARTDGTQDRRHAGDQIQSNRTSDESDFRHYALQSLAMR